MLTVIMVLGGFTAFAQQDYFVYLQTDNGQTFYVRLNNRIFSSAASGYLVLSPLPDSIHQVTVGFPKNTFPEQEFTIPQNHKDAGFLLKNFGEKGWGLFNLQTLAVIMNNNSQQEKKSPEITGARKTDPFSLLLSNAVNDTSILYTSYKPKPVITPVVTAKEEKKPDTLAVAVNASKEKTMAPANAHISKKDSSTAVKNTPVKKDNGALAKNKKQAKADKPVLKNNIPAKNAVVQQPPLPDSRKDTAAVAKTIALNDSAAATPPQTEIFRPVTPSVVKAAELLTDTSYIAVFIDEAKENNDTVRISIPFNEQYVRTDKNPFSTKQPAAVDKELQKEAAVTAGKITVQDSTKTNHPIAMDSAVSPKRVQEDLTAKPAPTLSANTSPIRDSAAIVSNAADGRQTLKKDSSVANTDTTKANTGMKPILINSDCKATAWDSDIDKLRIKMLAGASDDDKIDIARKLYHQKCLTVRQVRALSELFTTDQGKYKWLDAVYPFTSNSYYFSELEDLLKDEYFRNRFKAMIRH